MAATTDPASTDWKVEARRLRDEGQSERQIAAAIGKAPSTIHEALKAPDEPDPIPGQQTIDGNEVSTNGFREEAGEPVGPMPPRPPHDDQLPPLEEIRVDGTTQLGLFDAGGKKPQKATLALRTGPAKIVLNDGQAFRKGDTIGFQGVAKIVEVAQKDNRDKQTGIPVSAEQKHVAVILDLRVVPNQDD